MLDFKFNTQLKDFDLARDLKYFDLARDLKNEIKSYEELEGIFILRLGWTSMPDFVSMVQPCIILVVHECWLANLATNSANVVVITSNEWENGC